MKITSTHEKAGASERVFLEALATKCSQGKGGQGSFLLSSKPRKHWTNWISHLPSSRAVSLRLRSVISKASIADLAFEADFGPRSRISNLLCCVQRERER